jgi:UDP-glucose 4-epimerase
LLKPRNSYGISKAQGEELCREFADRIEVAILRLANVYGPGDSNRVLPIFLENAFKGYPLKLFGGQQVIDFVWIDAIVTALVEAAATPIEACYNLPINVGSGKGTTIAELARRVLDATGSRSPIQIEPARSIEVSRFVADVTRATKLLRLKPPSDPLHMLTRMVALARTGTA